MEFFLNIVAISFIQFFVVDSPLLRVCCEIMLIRRKNKPTGTSV